MRVVAENSSVALVREQRDPPRGGCGAAKPRSDRTRVPEAKSRTGLMPPQGFTVLPRRWVVERTFSWLGQNRRMSKDYERLPESSEAFVYVAMSRLMARRMARA